MKNFIKFLLNAKHFMFVFIYLIFIAILDISQSIGYLYKYVSIINILKQYLFLIGGILGAGAFAFEWQNKVPKYLLEKQIEKNTQLQKKFEALLDLFETKVQGLHESLEYSRLLRSIDGQNYLKNENDKLLVSINNFINDLYLEDDKSNEDIIKYKNNTLDMKKRVLSEAEKIHNDILEFNNKKNEIEKSMYETADLLCEKNKIFEKIINEK
jgi:hypothetical protein